MKNKLENLSNAVFVVGLLALALSCRSFGGSSSVPENIAAGGERQLTELNKNSVNAEMATSQSDSSCENAFYPIGEKVERKYRITYQGGAMPPKEYTQTYGDISENKFTERNKFSDVQNAINFQCTADGLQGLQFDNGNSLSMGNSVRGKLETVKSEGLTVPAESRWRVGEKWTGNYTVHFDMQMGGGAGGAADATISGASEIVSEESITVAAGTFQVFKVQTKTVFRYTTVKVNGASVPMNQTLNVNTTAWHAKNVGMVKSVMTGAVGGATTEILSINNP